MISAESVTVMAGVRSLLRGVTLDVRPGEVLALCGPNGAGKSTLLRVLSGELSPAAGAVRVAGRAISQWTSLALARRRAVVPQHGLLSAPYTVAEVVAFGAWVWSPDLLPSSPAVQRVLARVGIAEWASRFFTTLSGGEKQRVQIARALMQLEGGDAPSALLLDEPTASLDLQHQHGVLSLLQAEAHLGRAVLVVLHDLGLAARYADRVALLAGGRLVAIGASAEVLRPPVLDAVYRVPFVLIDDPVTGVQFPVALPPVRDNSIGVSMNSTIPPHAVSSATSPDALVAGWARLRQEEPRLRQRDAAERLGVSEGELVAAHVGRNAVALEPDWRSLFEGLCGLGEVMALTRNAWIVSETHGRYCGVDFSGGHGLVIGDGIDLRAFPATWRSAFALTEEVRGESRTSVQIYDRYGVAVHKVFPVEGTDGVALEHFVGRLTSPAQPRTLTVDAKLDVVHVPDPTDKTAALRDEWSRLEDTHAFFPMLRRLGIAREAALRLAGTAYAERLTLDAHRRVFETASESAGLPIMVFVGNDGMIQIYTGPVKQLRVIGTWFNVLDPAFSLHLDESGVASAWLVRKPTRDGVVTSVELFDVHGKNLALLFGERKPGRPESLAWRSVVEALPRLS